MAYYEDLTPYQYSAVSPEATVLNVGWLDAIHCYTKGNVPEKALDSLFSRCRNPVNRMRGLHSCGFCQKRRHGCTVQWRGANLLLGSAEIRITSASGVSYASPDMIFHYVKDHNYAPPQEFLEALMQGG